jgi:curli biogenesis system outer membrane secretion channel CsgG
MKTLALVTASALASAVLLAYPAASFAGSHDNDDAPVVESSRSDNALLSLPRLPVAQRKVVTIYQFRSGVSGIDNQAATDMFTKALLDSGAFLVAERETMATDLTSEKVLNATGRSTGDSAQHPVVAAQYIFEGTLSEENDSQDSTQNDVSVGGMDVNHASQKGKIAIDVRVVDAQTGLVMDAVTVSKVIRATSNGVSGVGGLANSIAGLGGASIPLSPDYSTQTTHNDSVDNALRQCIEAAVLELVKRYGAS